MPPLLVRVLPHALLVAVCVALGVALAEPSRARAVVVGGGVVGAVVAGGGSGVVAAKPTASVLPEDPGATRFLALVTADDAARGVFGLQTVPAAPPLTTAQRAELVGPLADGLAARKALAVARTEARASRGALVTDGLALAQALGPEVVAHYAARPGVPTGPSAPARGPSVPPGGPTAPPTGPTAPPTGPSAAGAGPR